MPFEEFKDLLVAMGLPGDDILPTATREEAGLDSLTVVELTLELRQRYGITVAEEEIHAVETVAGVAELIGTRRAGS